MISKRTACFAGVMVAASACMPHPIGAVRFEAFSPSYGADKACIAAALESVEGVSDVKGDVRKLDRRYWGGPRSETVMVYGYDFAHVDIVGSARINLLIAEDGSAKYEVLYFEFDDRDRAAGEARLAAFEAIVPTINAAVEKRCGIDMRVTQITDCAATPAGLYCGAEANVEAQ